MWTQKSAQNISLVIILNFCELENALLDKEETITINDMALNFQKDIRSFIRSLLNVELKHDPMGEEAYHTCSYLNN